MVFSERWQKTLQTTKQSIHDSLGSFRAHRLRSVLTSLGVIFGVAAVIAMLAITEGAKQDAISAIEQLGLRNIYVIASTTTETAEESKKKNPDGLTQDDGTAIAEITPGVKSVIPMVYKNENVRGVQVVKGLSVVGANAQYLDATNRSIRYGRLLHEFDERDGARVVVLGSAAAQQLFPAQTAIGKFIQIKHDPYRVVGVLSVTGTNMKIPGIGDWEPDKEVLIPISTATRLLLGGNRNAAQVILVEMNDENAVPSASQIIQQILDRRHRGAPDAKVVVPEELLAQSQRTQRTFTIIMAAIAGISLLVGGIGIMNIMLSSVLERTQEIGVRRAMGATQREIARQFLTEAALLSGGGGIIGMVLGVGLAYIVTLTAGWVTVITVWSIFLSLGVAIGVGIVFGLFPAKQAARLDPIDALRYSG